MPFKNELQNSSISVTNKYWVKMVDSYHIVPYYGHDNSTCSFFPIDPYVKSKTEDWVFNT